MVCCSQNKAIKKPKNLIDPETMEKVLYDVSLMNSFRSNSYTVDSMKVFFADDYIYKKYNIDSLQLVESELYYSKYPKTYLEMYKKVLLKLTKLKDSMENVTKEESKKLLKKPL
ncbi:DUF4296 domain-containing protein [Flavobacteriaceae bacterium]|nr:DUF4296 domain-containing protein [Flavobacteriaceae bacterium]